MTYFINYNIIEKMQYDEIGIFIRNKRKNAGFSLNAFALNNDIEPAILCRVEKQQQDVKYSILVKIAKGFGMKLSELIEEFENAK